VTTREEWFEIRVKISHLPPQTRSTRRFGTWERRPELVAVEEACQAFADRQAPHHFLTLSGITGTGKTHLAMSIGWNWLEEDRGPCCYWRVPLLLDFLKSGFSSYHEERWESETWKEIQFMTKCPLLVLDDIGSQKETDWSWEQIDTIIDARYVAGLPLVATMNVSGTDLPQRIYDRLREGQVFILDAPSYRGLKGIGVME